MPQIFKRKIDLIIFFCGNVMIKGSLFLSWIIVARILGAEEYGIVGLIKSTVLVSSLIFLLGLPNEIIRKFSLVQKNQDYKEKNEIFSGIIIGYLLIIFAALIVALFFYDSINKLVFETSLSFKNFQLFLLFFLVYSLSILLTSILNGFSNFAWQGLTNIILSIFCIPVIFYLTKIHGLNGTLFGVALIYFFQSFSYFLKIIKSNVSFILDLKILKELKRLVLNSKYIFLHETFYSISNMIFLVMMVKTLNFHDLGLFNAGEHLTQMILFIPTSFLGYFLNQFLLKKTYDASQFRFYFLKYSLLFSTTVAIFFMFLKDLMLNFYGSDFIDLNNILLIFFISIIPQMFNAVYQQNLIADAKTFLLFKVTFYNSLILVIGASFFLYYDVNNLVYFVVLKLFTHFSQSVSLKIFS